MTNADSQSQDEWAAEMSSTTQHYTSSFVLHSKMTITPEKIILNCWRKSFQKMPVSASLSERLSFLEKKMTDNDNKPYDEELYNMMKVSNVK